MSTRIIVSDLHLTDRPLDGYRWGLFPWLVSEIISKYSGLKELFILGDLTEAKDRHSATLVNLVVENIVRLYRGTGLHGITLLRGNHDGLGDVAYFEFLRNFPFIKVITKPVIESYGLTKIALLPHTKNPTGDWAVVELGSVKNIYMHQTVKGSLAENGIRLEGDESSFLKDYKARVISGDVHVPQKIGSVEYVGAPYPIKFGDDFKGRVLIQTDKGEEEAYFPTIRKVKRVIKGMKGLTILGLGLRKGDQVKFELQLSREEVHEFQKAKDAISEWCEKREVVLCGVELKGKPVLNIKGRTYTKILSSLEALKKYGEQSETSERVMEIGEGLLKRAQETLERGLAAPTLRPKSPTQPLRFKRRLRLPGG